MTAAEFEAGYAERSGLSVQELRDLDLVVRSCDCGERDCKGWRMVGLDEAARIDAADESQAT
jgi:hypothetical protein